MTHQPLAVWIGNLAAYNGGRLFGEWFNPSDYADAEDFVAAVKKAVIDPIPGSEEWHICDHEHFPSGTVGRYSSLERVWRIADLIESDDEHRCLVEAACEAMGSEYVIEALLADADWVRDRWARSGELADVAYEDLEELKIPSWVEIDYERTGRTLAQDYALGRDEAGTLHWFANV